MKFGKLQNIDHVDFSLPPIPKETYSLLQRTPKLNTPKFSFGCTGWSMKEWVGSYYPAQSKTKDFLYHYSRQFNTIELNTTHYRIPKPSTIKQWYEQSSANFKFAPKIPQVISHSTDLGLSNNTIELFCESIKGLKEKLGISFMQLPPTFGPKRLSILKSFLDRFPTNEVPLAIELRHEDWFNNPNNYKNLMTLLGARAVGVVLTDVAGRRDVLHMHLTTPIATIRFVGNNLVPSDYERIDSWVHTLKNWIQMGLQEVYFFAHQPDNLQTPETCTYLIEQVNKVCNWDLKVPKKIINAQMQLF
ncbi:MAG: DUF72 domain-containing protein [Aureispira sp.]|nr:DUF72 domain-containing protein [Aureispira sp.]